MTSKIQKQRRLGSGIVSYSMAKALKKYGFNHTTPAFYDKGGKLFMKPGLVVIRPSNNHNGSASYISAPRYENVAKWLRMNMGIFIQIRLVSSDTFKVEIAQMNPYKVEMLKEEYHSYKEALQYGVKNVMITLMLNEDKVQVYPNVPTSGFTFAD